MSFEERIKKLNELIKNAKKIVFFGGAGVSTESGISVAKMVCITQWM